LINTYRKARGFPQGWRQSRGKGDGKAAAKGGGKAAARVAAKPLKLAQTISARTTFGSGSLKGAVAF